MIKTIADKNKIKDDILVIVEAQFFLSRPILKYE